MQDLTRTLGWTDHLATVSTASSLLLPSSSSIPSATALAASTPDPSAALKTLNKHLKTLTAALPPSTALVIYTGCNDPRQTGALNRKKALWDHKIRAGIRNEAIPAEERWTSEDAEILEVEVEKTRAGLAFFCVTLGQPKASS